ncbi:ATP-binding cassette domain-containing protein, partial [Enterococcus faecalis]|nr:ATP-binding cassette domain-containing protein [Enterococcus faecalis]
MKTKALEICNLTKTFKDFKLDNVSFTLPVGFIMGLVGENGAGKTTTIKLIFDLLEKENGVVKVFGNDTK